MLLESAGFHSSFTSRHDYVRNRHHRALDRCSSVVFSKSDCLIVRIMRRRSRADILLA